LKGGKRGKGGGEGGDGSCEPGPAILSRMIFTYKETQPRTHSSSARNPILQFSLRIPLTNRRKEKRVRKQPQSQGKKNVQKGERGARSIRRSPPCMGEIGPKPERGGRSEKIDAKYHWGREEGGGKGGGRGKRQGFVAGWNA